MKKWQKVFFCVCVIVVAVLIFGSLGNPEYRIRAFVTRNQVELEKVAKAYLTGGGSAEVGDTYKRVEIDGTFEREVPIVQFYDSGFGLVPSSVYHGFYYSPEDVPVPYINEQFPLKEETRDVWTWQGVGDNGGRIKKICTGWYYYEAWF